MRQQGSSAFLAKFKNIDEIPKDMWTMASGDQPVFDPGYIESDSPGTVVAHVTTPQVAEKREKKVFKVGKKNESNNDSK